MTLDIQVDFEENREVSEGGSREIVGTGKMCLGVPQHIKWYSIQQRVKSPTERVAQSGKNIEGRALGKAFGV